MYPTQSEAAELIAELCRLFYGQVGRVMLPLGAPADPVAR